MTCPVDLHSAAYVLCGCQWGNGLSNSRTVTCQSSTQTPSAELSPIVAQLAGEFECQAGARAHLGVTRLAERQWRWRRDVIQLEDEKRQHGV